MSYGLKQLKLSSKLNLGIDGVLWDGESRGLGIQHRMAQNQRAQQPVMALRVLQVGGEAGGESQATGYLGSA